MFWILFAGLLAASGATFYFLMREDKEKESKQVGYQVRIGQLEAELSKKDKQKDELVTQLKNELNAQLGESKNKLAQTQEALNKENLDKQSLETKIRELEAQVSKLNKELALSTEMYDGLKVQYNDLERDIEKIQQPAISKTPAVK